MLRQTAVLEKPVKRLALFVYNHFFSNNRAGYGQMASIIMLIIVVVITGITTKLASETGGAAMNKNPDRMKPDRKVNLPLSILMWVIVAVFAMPFYILIVYAVKPREATMLKNPLSLPTSLCWENFTEAIEKSKFTLAFCNSLIATISGTLLLVIVCSMAAYVIVRRERSRFYNAWQYIFLAAVMLPFQTVMFPLYKNLVNLHMLNTLWGYVLVSVGFQLGFNIFLYCGFIKTVPLELEEAAQIDGCNAYGTYFKIVFPLLKPITMTVVVLAALGIWNDYQIALVVIMKDNVRTLPGRTAGLYRTADFLSQSRGRSLPALDHPDVPAFPVLAEIYCQGHCRRRCKRIIETHQSSFKKTASARRCLQMPFFQIMALAS